MNIPLQKSLKNETGLSVLLITLTTIITYGLSIPSLGWYHDDWYLLWSGAARGAQSIIPLFSTDRPFMGVVYSLVYRLLGDSLPGWHIYALAWRLIGALAFFWILRLLWPENKPLTTLMAVLFVIYPGFLSQPNANTKQNHLYGFGTALLSMALMLQSLYIRRRAWKIVLGLLSFLLAINYLFIYEYMIGLEGMRLALLGIALFRQGFKDWRSLALETLKKWWPYPLAMGGFVYWRIFIFDSTRNATDASRLAGDYLGNLRYMSIRLVVETAKDFLDTTLFVWGVKPYQLFSGAEYSALAAALLTAAVVIALVLGYLFLYKKWWAAPEDETRDQAITAPLTWLGVFVLVCAIFPVVLSGRDVDLLDAYKSYGLHPAGGVVMLITGLLLMLRPKFRNLILVVLVGVSVSTQVLNAGNWARLWDYQRETWWQLTWRAPDIQNDTMLMVYFPDGYRMQQDYEVWGPVNLIYRPGPAQSPAIQSEVLTADTAYDILKKNVLDNRDRDIKMHRDFTNLLLVSLPGDNSCVHVIDGSLPVYSESESLAVQQVGAYSRVDRILPGGEAPRPPAAIFGSEPAHSWCYFYQKAALARQSGDWEQIGRLYDQAQSLKLEASDKSELMPFFEGLVNLGRLDDARALYNHDIKGREKLRFPMCAALATDPNYPPAFRYNYQAISTLLCHS